MFLSFAAHSPYDTSTIPSHLIDSRKTESDSSTSLIMAIIEGIEGNQYPQGTEGYDGVKSQYATSTYEGAHNLNPALIVQPKTKEDIAKVLMYAKRKKIAVAIRTGGHQYDGASSTGAPNIQLDLRHTFRSPGDRAVFERDGKTYARTSVSWNLGEFNDWLTENNVFVPHGQCVSVNLGGHVQTGGKIYLSSITSASPLSLYSCLWSSHDRFRRGQSDKVGDGARFGQMIRSFGLLGDHVSSLEIVDAKGRSQEITKETDPDLYWAFLGGSPGNLGVLTHLTIQTYRNQDHRGSRGLKALYFYRAETLKRLMDIVVEMSDDEDFPRNYDLCVNVLSSDSRILSSTPGLETWAAREHRELYGQDGRLVWPRAIVLYAQWIPAETGDVCDMAWFDQMKEGADSILVDPAFERPASQLMGEWILRSEREFDHPYIKRTYSTRSRTLGRDGWASWFVGRIDNMIREENNGCWVVGQAQCVGGKNSMLARNADNGTSYNWRDTAMCCNMDCFHTDEAEGRAKDWQKINDIQAIGHNGIFSKEDRRQLWGSYGNWDLDAMWNCYYDDRAKYEKLQRIRRAVDPDGTLTPNPFAVKRADWSLGYLISRLVKFWKRIIGGPA
ncbi:FAD-binding domain-containing protein [Durotheca rogersii]|uniref:FAD-binding domain-containing protein n=1 Tax=Durotheca rogersii TaxID=419775 RepID=UPI00221E70D2|nr:FAD-binding domain-containing protein [Durotheca rogersii]KAI5865249.1 FAD-binding domain-containing protein [Durotheca rogersii]